MPADTPSPDDEIAAALADCERLARELLELFMQLQGTNLDAEMWLDVRARTGLLMEELNRPAKLVSAALGLRSGKDRLRAYLLAHLGEVVTNYELAGVAGTLEWARRVRELSVEEGWEIASDTAAGLRPGEYRLDADGVDIERASRWRTMNQIRRSDGSAADRCLRLLQAFFPEPASKDDLRYVARIQEWPRRMRELEEAGWSVISSNDDPSLAIGSYRLDTLAKGPPRRREAIRQRRTILERDNWTCRRCGARPATDDRVRLQIHHEHHVAHGGTNEDENLITLCVPCHAGEHSVAENAVDDELLNPTADPDR